ncbi:MAG: ATP-binding protein [Magnetococcales bacterium]|nr:ATP-binding protein [Magnetococcales bacterium]
MIEFKLIENSLREGVNGSVNFRTFEDAYKLSSILGGICPDSISVVPGLYELMLNAIEHGNLGIDYTEKTMLEENNIFEEEVEKRLGLDDNLNKVACISWQRTETKIIFSIKDQGKGFDWLPYMGFNHDRKFDNHGRGILIARTISFDNIEYKGSGNEVIATVTLGD